MAAILKAHSQSRGLHWWHHKSKPVCLVLNSRLSGHFQRWWRLNEQDRFRITMPRSTRRKRCLSIEEDDSLPHYSKYRCMDREHSSHAESRHSKRYSTRSRSHDRRRRTRHCSRSHSARRSERKSKRQKHRYEHSNLSTVRKKKLSINLVNYSVNVSEFDKVQWGCVVYNLSPFKIVELGALFCTTSNGGINNIIEELTLTVHFRGFQSFSVCKRSRLQNCFNLNVVNLVKK